MSSRIEVGGIQGVPQVDASIPCMIVPREVLEGREVLAGDESVFFSERLDQNLLNCVGF